MEINVLGKTSLLKGGVIFYQIRREIGPEFHELQTLKTLEFVSPKHAPNSQVLDYFQELLTKREKLASECILVLPDSNKFGKFFHNMDRC